jgi:pimeloyl-ACP methyl ester carboxylesterase
LQRTPPCGTSGAVSEVTEQTITVGEGDAARTIAVAQRSGGSPGLFWLTGFRSDMSGSKALAADALGAARGLAVTRFDYSGHGRSGGDFNDGTISRWLEEALAVFELTQGAQVIIGSSMGGWLALLLNRAVRERYGLGKVRALILIAPAVDMTEALMLGGFTRKEMKAYKSQGFVEQPSAYSDEPYRINRALIEDGRNHLLFGKAIETGVPVTIIQGARDRDVPKEHAHRLMEHLITDPVTFTLVPDAEHRLSRPEDIAVIEKAIERAVTL